MHNHWILVGNLGALSEGGKSLSVKIDKPSRARDSFSAAYVSSHYRELIMYNTNILRAVRHSKVKHNENFSFPQ